MPRKIASHTVASLTAWAVEEGDCLIWQRYSCNGAPMVHHEGNMVSCRALIALQLGKVSSIKGRYFSVSCGTAGCIQPSHIIFRDLGLHMKAMAAKMGGLAASMHLRNAKIAQARRKLTDEQIYEIRHSNESASTLAAKLGVSKTLVCQYRSGERGSTYATNIWSGLMR